MKTSTRLLYVFCAGLMFSPVEAMTTKTVDILDVHRYSLTHRSMPDTNYVIHAATFSSKAYADRYKKYVSKKTQKPIRIEHLKNRYYVYVGPFKTLYAMAQVGHKITAKNKIHKNTGSVSTKMQTKSSGVWKDMTPTKMYKTGPYVGISAGPQFNFSGLPTIYNTFEGTVSAGFGHVWENRLYLAGEIFGADGKKLKSYPASNSGYTIQSNWSAGVDILPGYMISDTVLGYLRLGWVQTDFNLATGTQGQATFAAASTKGGISNPRHVSTNAWQVGLGAQTNLYKNLDVRAEYIFSLYDNLSLIGKPQVSQINVGLLYQFDRF